MTPMTASFLVFGAIAVIGLLIIFLDDSTRPTKRG